MAVQTPKCKLQLQQFLTMVDEEVKKVILIIIMTTLRLNL